MPSLFFLGSALVHGGVLLSSSYSYSFSDPLFTHQGSALAHLDSLRFIIWCFGQTTLAYLPTALFVALRPLFPFQQAQYAQVFSLKPVPFCTLFAGLGSTNKSAISLLLLSDSLFCPCHPVLSSIFPFISNSVADPTGTVFSLLD